MNETGYRPSWRHAQKACAVGLLSILTACGGGSRNGGETGDSDLASSADPDGGSASGSGLSGGGAGLPSSTAKCPAGVDGMKLPVTGVDYCVKAHPDCKTAGAGCALVVTVNMQGPYFARVDDPASGKLIAVELFTETDGNGVKDKFAELPRVVAKDYPGLDPTRIHAVGWSAGAGAVSRALCHVAKKSDQSTLGTTSDLYASTVAIGGCSCTNDFPQISGNWHVLSFVGTEDPFDGGDSCESGLAQRARTNGCKNLGATWVPVAADDPYAKNGTGNAAAEKIDFGPCERGEVVGYRGHGEGHVPSFKTNFDPKISGFDTAFRFVIEKRK